MTWFKEETAEGGYVWTGPCGCGRTPEQHVAMDAKERNAHKSVPPKGAPRRPTP